jgi:hypothetical protein
MHDRYYVDLGQACDAVVRCKDCQSLVTHAIIQRRGCCPRCGGRRMMEITTLSLWEWLRMQLGLFRFPYRRQFLAEFRRS